MFDRLFHAVVTAIEFVAMNRAFLACVLLAMVALILVSDATEYLTLSYFQAVRADLTLAVAAAPWTYRGGFFLAYIVVAALSIPGATIMTLAAGALFHLRVRSEQRLPSRLRAFCWVIGFKKGLPNNWFA